MAPNAQVLGKHCKNFPCMADQWYGHTMHWGQGVENNFNVNKEYGGNQSKQGHPVHHLLSDFYSTNMLCGVMFKRVSI